MSLLTPKAVRVKTGSGWQDIALTGPPGPPGFTPSAKAHGTFSWSAADQSWRVYAPALTVDYDGLGGSFSPDGMFTAVATGRYLVGFHLHDTAGGNCGIMPLINASTADHGLTVTTPASSSGVRGGVEHWGVYNLSAGDNLRLYGWHSAGGTTTLYIEAIRLDAPPVYLSSSAPMYVTPAEFAALTPVDGLEVYLRVNDAAGVRWHLRYNASSSSAYKWEFVGGAPLSSRVDGQENLNNTGYTDLATVGPQVVVPRLGEYRVQFGCRFDRVSVDSWGESAPKIGGATVDADNAVTAYVGSVSGFYHVSRSLPAVAVTTDTTAGRTIKQQYISQGNGTITAMRRWLEVTPVRIA